MLKIEYKLAGTGWLKGSVKAGTKETRFWASYLSDVLGDMLSAVVLLTKGETQAIATFEDEPGEYRWWFMELGNGMVLFEISSYDVGSDDEAALKKYAHGEVIELRTVVSVSELAQAVYKAASRLLKKHGKAGYQKKWVEHPFPETQYKELEQYVEKQEKYQRSQQQARRKSLLKP